MPTVITDSMKPHRPKTADRRIGASDHPPRNPGAATRLTKQAVGATRRDQLVRRGQDRDLKSALELRYQVYCLECSFLSPDDYPEGVETDEHDAAAEHFYAFDANQELVGYVRLVRPDANQRFPFQKHCALSAGDVTLPVPGHAVEISRLMVRHDYRRQRATRLADAAAGQTKAASAGERRDDASQVLLTLYRQMYAYSRANGIGHWYAAMERPLARSLLRLNFAFRPIGPQTDYYGPVAPYLANLQELEAQVGARHPALLAWLQQPEWQSATAEAGGKWQLSDLKCPNPLVRTLQ